MSVVINVERVGHPAERIDVWQATCSCGWRSDMLPGLTDVDADAAEHRRLHRILSPSD